MDASFHREIPEPDKNRTRALNYAGRVIFLLAVGVLCGWALTLGVRTTWPCRWPAEWDTLRDISMAQTILDGRYPEDPILLNETLWYNPLTGAIIALSGWVSGLPLYRASILIGPYVNLLAPLGIVVLLAVLFGRATALAGLCVVLFAKNPHSSFWVHACYSPWLLAPLYSLGLFFLTLTACYHGMVGRTLGLFLISGVLLGVTFMAHTAPALVAGGTIALALLVETAVLWHDFRRQNGNLSKDVEKRTAREQGWELVRLPAYFLALLAVAFVISLPFTWSILWNYRFQVQNPFPSLYAADYVALTHLPDRVRDALNWRNALALAGAVVLIRRCRDDFAARFVLCWTFVAFAFVLQHYLWQAFFSRGIVLTALVPGHHAAIHLSAVRAALFAVGAATVGSAAAGYGHALLRKKTGRPLSSGITQIGAVIGAAVAGLMLYLANPLPARIDFQPPDPILYYQYHERHIPMYQWILENTSPDAVFLCEEEVIGMTVVMPAGRKLVAAMLLYSNPYVPPTPLFEAQSALFNAIERGDRDAFCAVAKQYPTLYLLVGEETAQAHESRYALFFEQLDRSGGLVVWQARPCGE